MSKNPAKDFGAIADDYVFFESHATQAEQDARAYVDRLASIVLGAGSDPAAGFRLRFGVVHGAISPTDRLAARALANNTRRAGGIRALPSDYAARRFHRDAGGRCGDPADRDECRLRRRSREPGFLLRARTAQATGPAGRCAGAGGSLRYGARRATNKLIEFWITGFRLLGQRIPYNTAEDVEIGLQQVGVVYQKQQVAYELTFADTEENRMRILRFLLADHLTHMPQRPLLDLFNQYAQSGLIKIPTASEHFTIRAKDEYDE